MISGRALEDLKSMVQLAAVDSPERTAWSWNSAPRPAGIPPPKKATAQLTEIRTTLQGTIAPYAGAWIEAKPLGLTVHFRQVAKDRVEDLKAALQAALDAHSARLRVLPGPMALEILPALGWTKGTAVQMMVAHAGPRAIAPCYFGDHVNDASAFAAVVALGGLAVGIGESAPATARFRLPGPHALLGLLASLAKHH